MGAQRRNPEADPAAGEERQLSDTQSVGEKSTQCDLRQALENAPNPSHCILAQRPGSGLVKIGSASAAPATPKFSAEAAAVGLFQVSLSAEQLARLWLREATLNSSNVLAWSSKKGQWVPALSLPEVTREITRARVDRMRMLTVLDAARNSVSVPPPSGARHSSHELLPHAAVATIATIEPPSVRIRRKPKAISIITGSTLKFAAADCRKAVLNAGAQLLVSARESMPSLRLPRLRWVVVGSCVAIVTMVPLGIRHIGRSVAHAGAPSVSLVRGSAPSRGVVQQLTPASMTLRPGDEKTASSVNESAEGSTNTPTESPIKKSVVVPAGAADKSPRTQVPAKLGPFNSDVATLAINRATARARECTNSEAYGNVQMTFWPSGYARDVQLKAFTGDSAQGRCVTALFRGVRVAPFAGAPVTARKSFHLVSSSR